MSAYPFGEKMYVIWRHLQIYVFLLRLTLDNMAQPELIQSHSAVVLQFILGSTTGQQSGPYLGTVNNWQMRPNQRDLRIKLKGLIRSQIKL